MLVEVSSAVQPGPWSRMELEMILCSSVFSLDIICLCYASQLNTTRLEFKIDQSYD